MPVAVWDCPDLGLLYEPLDTATVLSDDIWKKFDLDFPLERGDYSELPHDDGVLPELLYDKMSCLASREIRHHDCMWAGLCISKEHNRTLPAKKDSHVQKKVTAAGRSLLIPRAVAASHASGISPATAAQQQQQQQQKQQSRLAKNAESDGDSSTRPETPQSSASDTETEDEGPYFRHEQINIHEKLSECMAEAATKAMPVSEVTGQLVRFHDRRKQEEERSQCQVHRETNIRNTLSDHCYHLNQPIGKSLEHLGVQTPSDSEEEEIDVVTFEKPCRPAALPTYPSLADQQHFQLTVNTAFKEKTPRPRGRPPSNPARKRANAQADQKPAKRARHRTYQRRSKPGRCTLTASSSSPSTKLSAPVASRSSSDDELDTEKRSLHNNMERQRRIELRNAFEELRVLVPAVEAKEKAPKVAILRQAAVYCHTLYKSHEMNAGKVAELQKRQDKLRARLSQLRKSLALTR